MLLQWQSEVKHCQAKKWSYEHLCGPLKNNREEKQSRAKPTEINNYSKQ